MDTSSNGYLTVFILLCIILANLRKVKTDEQATPATQINVVQNWFEELQRRVPVP